MKFRSNYFPQLFSPSVFSPKFLSIKLSQLCNGYTSQQLIKESTSSKCNMTFPTADSQMGLLDCIKCCVGSTQKFSKFTRTASRKLLWSSLVITNWCRKLSCVAVNKDSDEFFAASPVITTFAGSLPQDLLNLHIHIKRTYSVLLQMARSILQQHSPKNFCCDCITSHFTWHRPGVGQKACLL